MHVLSAKSTFLLSYYLAVAIVSAAFAPSVGAAGWSDVPGCGDSHTDCYLKHLGPPRTQEEWFLGYIGALAERCMASQVSDCNPDHFCTVVVPGVSHDQAILLNSTEDKESLQELIDVMLESIGQCILDLPRFLGRPCLGSRDDILQRCGAQTNTNDCNKDTACIWLRNGWWLEPDGKQKATLFSNVSVDTTVMRQGGAPPTYACWPKWHVPYAAAKWPYTHWNMSSMTSAELPLVCPTLASLYPCFLNTVPTLEASDMGNASLCTDLAGFDGVCPHLQIARKVITGLQKGWDLKNASSAQATALTADCAHHGPEFTGLQLVDRPCIMQIHSWFSAFGFHQLPRRCNDVGVVPIAGADLCNVTANDSDVIAAGADDRCLMTLVSSSLWEGLGHLLLAPGAKGAGSPWYSQLHVAKNKCGTFDDWQNKCVSNDSKQADDLQGAALNSVIRQYERLFLTDANATALASATKAVYRCQGSVVRVYKALAAVWLAYAGMLLLGIAGLIIYWRGCEGRRKRHHARQAQVQLLRGLQAQKAPAPVAKVTWREWVMKVIWWFKPRLHAVMFLVDVGLDVYTLVKLTSSRWMWHMLAAIVTPYVLMAALLVPYFACCCGWLFLPAIWWYDLRMLFGHMGVHIPVLGNSKIAIEQYARLRMLFEGVFETVPSALISTAVLYDSLGLQTTVHAIPAALLWINLLSSFVRGATEIRGLAVLTHQQGYRCFATTITQMVWEMLSYRQASTGGPLPPTSATPHVPAGGSVSPPAQEPPLTRCATGQTATLPVGVSKREDGIMGDLERHCDCNCLAASACCSKAVTVGSLSGSAPGRLEHMPRHLALYVWFCVCLTTVVCILTCITIGCGGLLVQTGSVRVPLLTIEVPTYQYGGQATCGADSLFSALFSSGSCTLPNLEVV